MSPDPLEALRRPSSPRRPDMRFAAVLRQRVEGVLEMNTTDLLDQVAPAGIGVGIIHIKVPNADRAIAFYEQLLGWQSERFADGFTAHYVVNTSVLTVLTDNPEAASVRLFFPVGDVAAAVRNLERLGGRVDRSEIDSSGGGWAEADDGQGVAIGLFRPRDAYAHQDTTTRVPLGEIGYLTLHEHNGALAADFYSQLLGWQLDQPRPNGYRHALNSAPSIGLYGSDVDHEPVTLYLKVTDIADVVRRVPTLGGEVTVPSESPSGLNAVCTDDQGIVTYLWQPAPGY